jgi:hypothetical protein
MNSDLKKVRETNTKCIIIIMKISVELWTEAGGEFELEVPPTCTLNFVCENVQRSRQLVKMGRCPTGNCSRNVGLSIPTIVGRCVISLESYNFPSEYRRE